MSRRGIELDGYARFLGGLKRVHYSLLEDHRVAVGLINSRGFKRAFLNAYKAMLGCADCGTHQGRLDFDHRDKETKRFKINASLGYSWKSIRTEITKCDVRCAPCHTRRHHRDNPGFSINHRYQSDVAGANVPSQKLCVGKYMVEGWDMAPVQILWSSGRGGFRQSFIRGLEWMWRA